MGVGGSWLELALWSRRDVSCVLAAGVRHVILLDGIVVVILFLFE